MYTDFLKTVLENPFFVKYGLVGLFLNCVFASVIPFPIVLTSTALLMDGENPAMVFLIMSIGSISGGILTYFIGQDGKKMYRLLRKTHSDDHYKKSFDRLNKHGWVIIFALSLVPILTEIVTIIAGVQRYNFKKFAISMSVARTTSAFASVYFGNMFVQYFNTLKI
ncbi:MAG TPA: VTT domain-containing protein [Candidatus Nitrosotalea sp.]|nr:VTT domain-containing protein [Candidatus Nitrosotalea sp.]